MTAAGAGASAQLAISENLKMLPVLVLGLLKNVGILGPALLFIADLERLLGRYQTELADSARPQGIRSSTAHISAFPIIDPIHLPDILLPSQYASRGMLSSL